MADDDFLHEDDLQGRQNPALYPVGRALRKTYDAENHDSLGNDLTGLMLELARIEPDEAPLQRGALPIAAAPAAPAPGPAATEGVAAVSWWRAAVDRLLSH